MSNIDTMSVNAIRVLAADGVQKANSGTYLYLKLY
jgi:transketolase